MSRRDTIIISVLVNAALLAVLFTTAITKNSTLEEPKLVNKALVEDALQAKDMLANNVESKEENISNALEKPDIQKQFASLMEEKEEVKKDANIEAEKIEISSITITAFKMVITDFPVK